MCPSTCASSVVSRLWKYANNPTIAAKTTAPPPISSRLTLGFANPFGVSSSPNSSSVIRGAFVAFSSPTSISMLIVPSRLLCVNLFHLPDRACQVRSRLVKSVQCGNLVIVGARQRILRLNHFDIVRHSRFEAVSRLIHFFLRKLHAQVRHFHFIPRRLQVQQRSFHIQRDLVPQIVSLLLQLLDLQVRADNLCVYSPAGKQRHIYAGLVGVRRQRRASRRSYVRVISLEPQRRQPRILRCFLLKFRRFDLRFQRLPFLALRQRELDAWLRFRLGGVEETQRVPQLDGLPRVQVEQPAQTKERGLA